MVEEARGTDSDESERSGKHSTSTPPSEDLSLGDEDGPPPPDPMADIYDNYCNDYRVWERDGERFMTEGFIAAWLRDGTVPLLNDGRPELEAWLGCTLGSAIFLVDWDQGSRDAAGDFAHSMKDKYVGGYVLKAGSGSLLKLDQIITGSHWRPDETIY
jgi:hypothetical protein